MCALTASGLYTPFPRSWRHWAQQQRQAAARQRVALRIYQRRLLAAALRQWRWAWHVKALLRRVFGTAVELWGEQVGGVWGAGGGGGRDVGEVEVEVPPLHLFHLCPLRCSPWCCPSLRPSCL